MFKCRCGRQTKKGEVTGNYTIFKKTKYENGTIGKEIDSQVKVCMNCNGVENGNFHKYTKIRVLGDEENKDIFSNPDDQIIIEEKVDGANFRFMIVNGVIIFGSHSQQLTSDEGEDTNIEKNFRRCVNHIREVVWSNIDISESKKFEKYIFFGENMVRHTLSYNWEEIPPFLGFDIFDLNENKYLDYEKVCDLFSTLGLKTVPLIKITTSKEILLEGEINDNNVPISKYAPRENLNQKAEGIVIKNYSKQIFAKYVRQEFKEDNRKSFGDIKKYTTNDEDYLTALYCTNARIDKIIFKLVDEGEKLHLSMMAKLPNKVYKDIWEEHWNEIYNMRQKTVNFDLFRKAVTKRCLSVLNQVIVNNSIK